MSEGRPLGKGKVAARVPDLKMERKSTCIRHLGRNDFGMLVADNGKKSR
jgi:hypothetical protein